MDCFVASLLAMTEETRIHLLAALPNPSLRAKRSNPSGNKARMDCFVAIAPLRKRCAFVAGNDGGTHVHLLAALTDPSLRASAKQSIGQQGKNGLLPPSLVELRRTRSSRALSCANASRLSQAKTSEHGHPSRLERARTSSDNGEAVTQAMTFLIASPLPYSALCSSG